MGLEGDKETKMEEAQAWGFLLCVHHSTNEGSSILESMSAPSIWEGISCDGRFQISLLYNIDML